MNASEPNRSRPTSAPARILVALLALMLGAAGCKPAEAPTSSAGGAQGKAGGPTIALMPKSKGNGYFVAARRGAEDAASELGVKLLFDGPTEPDPARQNEIVETWITRGVDAIAVACENREAVSSSLRKARARGIKVVTYDADALPDARDFFVNQATPEGIGNALVDEAARLLGGRGRYAVITGSLTAGNMIEWQKAIERRNADRHPGLQRIALRPCDDLKDRAFAETTAILNAHPDVGLIMAICSPAVPGAAEAVKQAGKAGKVRVIGLGLPGENRRYLHEGVTDTVILWKVKDLGYLAVQAAHACVEGRLRAGATRHDGGRLGEVRVADGQILLGEPFLFTRANVDQFDF